MAEPEREEGVAGIREVAGLGFAGLELEAETTGITGGLGHRGKRRTGNDSRVYTLPMGIQPMRLSELNATSIQFYFDEMVPRSP